MQRAGDMGNAIVVGAGLKAIVAAHLLVRRGFTVTLTDRAKRLGGVHSSIPWDGFRLDIGCHLFGNEDDASTRVLLDLMGADARPVNPVVASVLNGARTDGIEYPDLTRLDPASRGAAMAGLLERAARRGDAAPAEPEPGQSLRDHLADRFGAAAAGLLETAFAKMLLAPAAELSAESYSALPARRLKITDDRTAELLKRVPAFDAVVLRSNADDPMRFLRATATVFEARALYPPAGGMGGFADAATRRLRDLGVDLLLETEVTGLKAAAGGTRLRVGDRDPLQADLVVWTAGWIPLAAALGEDARAVSAAVHPVPMALHYFDIPAEAAGPYHWIHDFDPGDRLFRASVPSLFGPDTAPAGRHYVCAEVPVHTDSELFRDPETHAPAIWDEVVRSGVAAGPLPEHRKVVTTPASYRFPRLGFAATIAGVEQRLAGMPGVLLSDEFNFGKSGSVREVARLLAGALGEEA